MDTLLVRVVVCALGCSCVCAVLGGCANFAVEPASGSDAPGLHFFLPKPYVLFWWERNVTVKSGTVIDAIVPHFQIIYLPDRSERYTVRQHALLATGDFAYTLRDGWCLETVNADMETTELLRLLADTGTVALERAIPRAAGPPIPETEPLPPPVLYELIWKDDGGTYTFRPVPLPEITLPPPPAGRESSEEAKR